MDHQTGEKAFEQKAVLSVVQAAIAQRAAPAEEEDIRVNTPGGRFQVRRDENGSAKALGRLAFLAEFLEVCGLFDRWAGSYPLSYVSPNAPHARNVLGTWLLSILDGQRRYAHVRGPRGDAVAPRIPGPLLQQG